MKDRLPDPLLVLRIRPLLQVLISQSEHLPEQFCKPVDGQYQRYLLYCDGLQRFSVLCSVMAPGLSSWVEEYPVWGLFAVLQGLALRRTFTFADGQLSGAEAETLGAGDLAAVSAHRPEIQQISNDASSAPLTTIEIFGGNIGIMRRRRFEAATETEFSSGYANSVLPNVWIDEGTTAHSRQITNLH
jgi:predicted metal-dependent enzyme (double-stranded beta helix superfamily)